MKVSQIQYTRITKEQMLERIQELDRAYSSADTIDKFLAVMEQHKQFTADMSTQMTLYNVRFSANTHDEYYAGEQAYYNSIMPEVSVAMSKLSMHYINTPLRGELEKILPPVLFANLQMRVDATSPKIIADSIEVNKLSTQYTQLMSKIVCPVGDKNYSIATIAKPMGDPDRAVRKSAYEALGKALADNGEQLDEIFDKMVALRHGMGVKMGYDNYIPLASLGMQRNCYDRGDISRFRANVLKHLVPLCNKIRSKVGSELGWSEQFIYDSTVYTASEPTPKGNMEELMKSASVMYNEMNEQAGKLFDTMASDECFDLESRDGKRGGGFCTYIPHNNTPYIFANFNGSSGDVRVLMHEFGHALAGHKSMDIPSTFLSRFSMETAEVHSMSMEFFTYPWAELFFGDKTDEFKFSHMAASVAFIPYGTIVDYFQEIIYTNPQLTPAERNAEFGKLQSQFMPWCDRDGIEGLAQGRFWQKQLHIYGMPFYYIDYCLAQFVALQFLAWSQEDYDGAFAGYLNFVSKGGTKTFVELVSEAGLDSPFEEESFVKVVATVEKLLKL